MSEEHAVEEEAIEARFRDHDPKKGWIAATFVRVVKPQFAEPYALLRAEKTGAHRSRPCGTVQIKVTGPKGGKRWASLLETEVYADAIDTAVGQ